MKKFLIILLLSELLLSYAGVAYAQTTVYDYKANAGVSSQIQKYLCAPTDGSSSGAANAAQNDLYNCINRLYKFAIIIAAVVSVFFVVVAGYLYISSGGNEETVTKAKSYITGPIAALVILFIGYILLNAINPDLIQFRSIQPPSVKSTTPLVCPTGAIINANGVCALPDGTVVAPVSGGTPTTGTAQQCFILAGYNIGPYATAPTHETAVSQTYSALQSQDLSSAAKISQYMQAKANILPGAPKTPLTGDMVLNAANSYGVDFRMVMALMWVDSNYGTQGLAVSTFNPGNVGNTDNGATKNYGNWASGVGAVANWLSTHKQASC